MDHSSGHRKPQSRLPRRRSWCCPFGVPPKSPENLSFNNLKTPNKPLNSNPTSPQSARSGFGRRMDPRRLILSPGRVSPSPIDSDDAVAVSQEIAPPVGDSGDRLEKSESFREVVEAVPMAMECESSNVGSVGDVVFDVRLNLKGKNGVSLVLELNSEVLSVNSVVFADLILENRMGTSSSAAAKLCRIEVPDVENLGVFRETIELMFEDDIPNRLLKIGVYRSIDILEVSAGIMFNKGVMSCLKYLEAVPWSEEEEEKLRALFTRFKFDDTTTKDILARLYLPDSTDPQPNLAKQLVWSITTCSDPSARTELKSLLKSLLCKSSVYEKDQPDLNKEDIYSVCHSCLASLLRLFHDTSSESSKPMIELVSRQVDNIIWLLEILLDRQMAEEFVCIWADQDELLTVHGTASPMVRYEISRVSAILFIAMGNRQLHCRVEARYGLLRAWFGPMLVDFGWLQRCKKGLDIKALEEGMGQSLLTLPLKQQYMMFMEWFRCFSKNGTECPNLSKSFQIWWRRAFLRGPEIHPVESR